MIETIRDWCDEKIQIICEKLINSNNVIIGEYVIAGELNLGTYFCNNNTHCSLTDIIEENKKLSMFQGYYLSDMINSDALLHLSHKMGKKFWVWLEYIDNGKPVHAFKMSPNPEEVMYDTIAYKEFKVRLVVEFFKYGVPNSLRFKSMNKKV